jgi:uncharacterized protein YdbL (DUF1318 family)
VKYEIVEKDGKYMNELEEEIFQELEEDYINKENSATDIVFEIMHERVRVATELADVSELSNDDISNITGLGINYIRVIKGL